MTLNHFENMRFSTILKRWKNIWNFSLFTTLLSMFYFRKLELILRFNELTANDAQCLSSKDTYSIAHSFKQLLLSIYLGVDKVKRYAQNNLYFRRTIENVAFIWFWRMFFVGIKIMPHKYLTAKICLYPIITFSWFY